VSAAPSSPSTKALTVPRAILWGGLVAGVLDAVDGVVAFGIKGMNPIQVLQYIASGLLGPASFKGGLSTAALGTVLHFLIAFVAAAVFVLTSNKIRALTQKPVLWGLSFGVVVYFFMNYLVLPLSAVPKGPFFLGLFLNGVIGHAFFVGLPIALYARRATQGR
jgi:uncharacterized membrane protein YagU involved in acid resistance